MQKCISGHSNHGISHIDNLEHIEHIQEDEIDNKTNESNSLNETDTLPMKKKSKKTIIYIMNISHNMNNKNESLAREYRVCWNPQISLTGIRMIDIHMPMKITLFNILIVIFIRYYKIYTYNHITSKVYFTYTTPLLQLVQFPEDCRQAPHTRHPIIPEK